MVENFQRHLILWSGGLASKKPILIAIMFDDRQCELFKFMISFAEILLVVVRARLRRVATNRAMFSIVKLAKLTRPTAIGAFDALADPFEKHLKGHIEG